jgi:hypothetical protein
MTVPLEFLTDDIIRSYECIAIDTPERTQYVAGKYRVAGGNQRPVVVITCRDDEFDAAFEKVKSVHPKARTAVSWRASSSPSEGRLWL